MNFIFALSFLCSLLIACHCIVFEILFLSVITILFFFSRLHNFFRPVYIQEFANVYVSMKYRTVWLLGQPLFCGKVDERIGII